MRWEAPRVPDGLSPSPSPGRDRTLEAATMLLLAPREGSDKERRRRDSVRARPQLEALEGRALLATADIQPFVNAVLRNAFARELAARHALPVLLGFIGRQAGNPGYLQFLDFNRDGVISRGGGPA